MPDVKGRVVMKASITARNRRAYGELTSGTPRYNPGGGPRPGRSGLVISPGHKEGGAIKSRNVNGAGKASHWGGGIQDRGKSTGIDVEHGEKTQSTARLLHQVRRRGSGPAPVPAHVRKIGMQELLGANRDPDNVMYRHLDIREIPTLLELVTGEQEGHRKAR